MTTTSTTQKNRKVDYSNDNYYIDIYSYNPFTDILPSTTEHWKYIKYKPKNNGIQTSFDFPTPTDAVDDNIWVLYGGSGGCGGSSKTSAGGGGGGGSGELKLSLLNKTTFTNIGCTIGKLNTQYSIDYGSGPPNGTSRNYNYNTTSATTLAIKKYTVTNETLTATGGFCGDYMNTGKSGGVGGHGANVVTFNGSNLVLNTRTITYDTTTITTIPFGSMGGGGGYGNGGSNAEMGDRYELFAQPNSTTKFDYKYVADTTVRKYTDGVHSGVNTNFNISLSGVQCDGTGTARILKPGDGGSAAAYGSNSEGGFIMFFYKTTINTFEQYSQLFPPFMNIYNYNPFTNLAPYRDNWIYYKYNSNDNTTPFKFKHTVKNIPQGENVWVLYAGAGGNNGGYRVGCGGGGGSGETVLSVIENVNPNLVLNCKIGSINYNSEASSENSKTTITYGSTTLTANEGFCGDTTSNNTGANGGTGGGMARDTKTTQDTSTDTTFRFGSGFSGGGGGVYGANNGEYGNQTICSLQPGSTTKYDYFYQVNNGRGRGGYGCVLDFSKTLKGYLCDGTGQVSNFLPGGNGGTSPGNNQSVNGNDGPPGFIMIFHKTTKPLTRNFVPPTGASFGVNPKTNFIPTYTTFINEKAYFFVDSGNLASVPASDFNTMFNLTSTTPYENKPKYLAVGGGGGGGSPWWCEYHSFGGGGGGGGQPKYGTVDFQTNTNESLTFIVGSNGGTGGKRGITVVGNSGDNGGDTTLTFANATTITAAGGGGGQNAADRRDELRPSLAGYGGGMGGRNNNVPSRTSGPSGGFGSCPIQRSSEASGTSYYDAKIPTNLEFYETGNKYYIETFEPGHFTWYQKITEYYDIFSYVAHTTYGDQNITREVYWRNGFDFNLIVSTDYFAQSSFRVTYGGDAGNDGLSGIRNQTIDWERSAYSGKAGGPGYILMWGKGPSGQVSSIYE